MKKIVKFFLQAMEFYAGFYNGNGKISIQTLWSFLTGGLSAQQLASFQNYLSQNWQRYLRPTAPGSGGGRSGGGFGKK